MKYQKLSETAIAEIRHLKNRGVRIAFIGKFAQAYYGVARSTVYRYVSENAHWYNESERRKRLSAIQAMLCFGYNSRQIAEEMNEPLARINKLIEDNKISVWNCPS